MSGSYTITKRCIPEEAIPGKPLGRHVNHDSRSRAFAFPEDTGAALASVAHKRLVPIFDQGNLGSCTGNAALGAVATEPFVLDPNQTYDEKLAVGLYEIATTLDNAPGSYPPDDTGSDGLSVAKACKASGLISGYRHAFSLNGALAALQTLPVITGVNWYEGFDKPSSSGRVKIAGQVRGGHEFEVVAIDVTAKTVTAANSWGASWGAKGYFTFSWDDWDRLLGEQGDVTVLLPPSVPAPTPTPPPAPGDPDAALEAFVRPWLAKRHAFYSDLQAALRAWVNRKDA